MKFRFGISAAALVLGAALASVASSASATTPQTIKDRGTLNCPVVVGGYPGAAELDDKGNWRGMDIDICKAIATAILGDPAKVNFVPLSFAQRFPSLFAGDIDVIVMGTSITMSRDTTVGLDFSLPYLYTGVQFLVPADSGVETAADLDGASICSVTGTTVERDITTYMRSEGIGFTPVAFERNEQANAAFVAGRCDAVGDIGQAIAVIRASQPNPEAYKIIPETPITLGATAIGVRAGDTAMLDIGNWVIQAMVHADMLDINSQNVEEAAQSRAADLRVAALLGINPAIGTNLGLRPEWARDVIREIGSYSEIYGRALGENSRYKIPAGYNQVFKKGGLFYPLPID